LNNITGVIEYLDAKEGQWGTMFSIKVNGTRYSLGKLDPTAKFGVVKGDVVRFSAAQNAKGYWDVKGPITKVAEAEPQVVRASPSAAAVGGVAATYRAAEDNKQKVISRQAARNSAIQFLQLAQAAGVLPAAPKTKGQGFDLLRDLLDKITDEFYNDSLNPKAYTEVAPEAQAAPAAAPADDDWGE
jgi:hypothetical protein